MIGFSSCPHGSFLPFSVPAFQNKEARGWRLFSYTRAQSFFAQCCIPEFDHENKTEPKPSHISI